MARSTRPQAGALNGGAPLPARRISPYDMLKQAIMHGELLPGQPLAEASLAAWCEVSRTPIREALTRLEQDGLVDRTDRGLVVRERSPEEILDIYEARMVLEARAGRTAAERRSDHDVRLLRRALQQGRDASTDDPRVLVEANMRFHQTVWRASHNEALLDLLERLNLHLLRYPETTLAHPGRWDQAMREHTSLADAIEQRDSEAAHNIAMAHFKTARDIRLAQFENEAPLGP